MTNYYITTVDNPYDPTTNLDEWLTFDRFKGYNTCERLASLDKTSDRNTEQENDDAILDSMEKMVEVGAVGKDGNRVEYKIIEVKD